MKIEPADRLDWCSIIENSPHSSPFHDFDWGVFVTKHLGGQYKPLLASSTDQSWLLPLYEGAPWSEHAGTGRIGSIGYGGPLPLRVPDNAEQEIKNVSELLAMACSYSRLNSMYATLYPSSLWDRLQAPQKFTQTTILPLTANEETIYQNVLSGNVRRSIRKSVACAVATREIDTNNHAEMAEAYNLLVETQKRIGAEYVTPESFFNALSRLRLSSTSGKTFVAVDAVKVIAVVVVIYNQREVFHLLHGWDRQYTKSFANQALIWRMVRFAISIGCQRFNMGLSHSESLLEAKLRWGGHVEHVPVVSYSLPE